MTTIADHLDAFLADLQRETRPNTLRAYRADLTLVAAHVQQPLDQVTIHAVEGYIQMGQPSPATVHRRVVSLRRFFIWAMRQGLCRTDPLAQYTAPPLPRRLPRPIQNMTDLALIDTGIAGLSLPYRLIFTLLRETGMRIGEVLALNKEDVMLTPGREGLHIREPKQGSERIAILGPNATPKSLRGIRAWIRRMEGQPGYRPLFCSNRGTRISYAAAQYQWTQLCMRAALVEADGRLRYTIHQLRHTRGSELVRQGQRMEIVQRVLGHRDIRSTQGYAALDDGQVREALEHGAQQR